MQNKEKVSVPYGKWGQVITPQQELPAEVHRAFETISADHSTGRLRSAYIWQLRELGWTGSAVSRAIGVSRERVRQLSAERPDDRWFDVVFSEYPLPVPPVYPDRGPVGRAAAVQPSAQTLARLLELQPIAETIRGNSKKNRAEAEEFMALLAHAVRVEQVQITTLAGLLGVTHAAIASRMVRYGYKNTTGTSKALTRTKKVNRVKGRI